MIFLAGLEFQYPKSDFELRIPTLELPQGQAVALIGPSGCGKTTLLHLIAGIIPNQTGTIRVGDAELSKLSDAERRLFRIRNIGFVFQDFALLEYLSLTDNILHPYRINPALKLTKDVRERVKTLAEQMGILHKLESFPHQCSHGEQQRAAICRALITEPKLILADEPTGNLDPSQKEATLELLLNYVKTHGATLLVTTHDHALLPKFEQVVDFSSWSVSPRVVKTPLQSIKQPVRQGV